MRRVAALLPAATDIVVALGAAERLVAITHACAQLSGLPQVRRITRSRVAANTPAETDRQVTDLSGAGAPLFDLDEEALASVAPDVIITQAVCDVCAVRADDVTAIASRLRPSPRVVTLGASTVDGVLADIATVGDALDLPDEAEELVAGLRGRMSIIHAALKRSRAPRPRVVVLEWTDPLFSAGHWVPDMVHRAGGVEVVGTPGVPSRRVSAEEIHRADPELLVVAPCGVRLADAIAEALVLRDNPAWRWPADRAWWSIDADALTSRPGPGVVHGIEVLARVLHPDLFGPPSPDTARSRDSAPPPHSSHRSFPAYPEPSP